MTKLKHVSEGVLQKLRADVKESIGRYLGEGFSDLAGEPGWGIERNVEVDLDALADLDGSERNAAADLKNSRIVMKALAELSPSLANEEQVWVRLSHVEAFAYSRDRWLLGEPPDKHAAHILTHFFAPTQTRIRDDNALSRLWWNGYIARHCMPEDPERALELMHTRLDVRSNLVERIWLMGRRKLAAGVFRGMEKHASILESQESFREFMKTLNMLGGGIVFEAMTPSEIDDFIERCAETSALQSQAEEESA